MIKYKPYKIFFTTIFILFVQSIWALDPAFDLYRSIKEDLKKIEYLISKGTVGEDRTNALSLIEELNEKIDSLLKYASVKANTISEEALAVLENRIRESTDYRKVEIITSSLVDGYIYSNQLARLIALFSFDSYRETAVLNIKNSIIDPINIGLVLEKFDFEINRRSVEQRFKKE